MQDIFAYNQIIMQMRRFFQEVKGFVEVPAQPRLSILAACEDPKTITQFIFNGVNYPLPQTGQMWLEREILDNPSVPGVFCITTSYRNEPFPIPGRHDKIFPMFEFEAKGDMSDMRKLEADLLDFLNLPAPVCKRYLELCSHYNVAELKAEQEFQMQKEFGNAVSLEYFPQHTHPFWNMKHDKNGIYNKIDVILFGIETIGSAERSTNVEEMRHNFHTISDGQYAKLLFNAFGEERVISELNDYLSLPMFPRFGAGVGITRMARAFRLAGLLGAEQQEAAQKAVA